MPHHACINICMPMGNGTLSFTLLIGIPSLIYIYIYIYIKEQDLDIGVVL